MDISFLDGLLGGGFTVLLALLGFLKTKGFKVLPADLEDQLKKLEGENKNLAADYKTLEKEVYTALGKVSIYEAGIILKRGAELKAGGYTEAELQELGKMVLEAVKD
jgi:hypothetical protein